MSVEIFEKRLSMVIGLSRQAATMDLFTRQCMRLIDDLIEIIVNGCADEKKFRELLSSARGMLAYQEAWLFKERGRYQGMMEAQEAPGLMH